MEERIWVDGRSDTASGREVLLRNLITNKRSLFLNVFIPNISDEEIAMLSLATHGYSLADLEDMCRNAAKEYWRDNMKLIHDNSLRYPKDFPPFSYEYFRRSLQGMNALLTAREADGDDDDDDDEDDQKLAPGNN